MVEQNIVKNEKYCFEKKYPLKYYEVDFKMVLKPSALLNFLQDMATINAEMLGFGYSFTYPKNYGWFLIKYHMEFDDYPQNLDEMIISTEARGISKILANRDFELWMPDKSKRLGRIASQWMMIDLENKNILPLAKVVDFMPEMQKRQDDLVFNKVVAPTKIDYEKSFEVRYDDIDVNRHVNNANYIVWAFEALPFEFKASNKLKSLDIVYKKELKAQSKVKSIVQLDEENKKSSHLLKNSETDEDLCIINSVWI